MATNDNPNLHVDLMFPSKYLKAADLAGKDTAVIISVVTKEKLKMRDGSEEEKYTVTFAGAKKRLVLNKTNANTIATALGEKRAKMWTGKRITLYPTTCMSFGKRSECIRVRETAPKQTAPARGGADLTPPPGEAPDSFDDEMEAKEG